MDGPNTLKGWNELLDYNLQTNNALRKSKFINYNFHDKAYLPFPIALKYSYHSNIFIPHSAVSY